jgi:hypothetical protein
MAAGDGQPCETPTAQALADWLELVCLAQGKVIFAASTFRREKMRCEAAEQLARTLKS